VSLLARRPDSMPVPDHAPSIRDHEYVFVIDSGNPFRTKFVIMN
jgi:hypothetical protein